MKITIEKSALNIAMALVLGGASLSAQAALITGTVLAFDSGVMGCALGGTYPDNCDSGLTDVVSGSWFGLDISGNGSIEPFVKTAMVPGYDGGIVIGSTQPGPGILIYPPPSGNGGGIDEAWDYFGSVGWHETTASVTVANDYGATKELDFNGWSVRVDGIGSIPLGGSAPADTGLATITCSTSSCSYSSTFVLDYTAIIPPTAPGAFGLVKYGLHLEGAISAVPIPAAAWLFGSGLIGLLGMGRRKVCDKRNPVGANRDRRLGTPPHARFTRMPSLTYPWRERMF